MAIVLTSGRGRESVQATDFPTHVLISITEGIALLPSAPWIYFILCVGFRSVGVPPFLIVSS